MSFPSEVQIWSTENHRERQKCNFHVVQIGTDNFTVSQGKQIRKENRESIEAGVLKYEQYCIAIVAAVMVSLAYA